MVCPRKAWKHPLFNGKEYVCPRCKRDKGTLYLFPDKSLRYICFCGSNVIVESIKTDYDFDTKEFKARRLN